MKNKNSLLFFSICIAMLFYFSETAAQCTINAQIGSSSGTCSGSAKLSINTFPLPSQIIWKKNGEIVSTSTPVPDTIGYTVAGGNGAGAGDNQINQPRGIFVDADSNVYVGTFGSDRVMKWAPRALSGVIVAGGNGVGPAANQLSSPTDIFVDNKKNIYIADLNNNRVQKWAPGAISGITVAGGNGLGDADDQISAPYGIYVTGNIIYVSDFTNHRVQKWVEGGLKGVTIAGGNGIGSAANQLTSPRGVVVDANNNLYIADDGNSRIQKWEPGAVNGITVAGGNGQGPAANQFNGAYFLHIDGSNNLFVSDWNNHRVQKWVAGAASGITVAGGNGQGPAANQLDLPTGLFLDKDGNLYIAERGNSRVQKWAQIINTDYVPAAPGNYNAEVINYNGCAGSTDTITINDGAIYTFTGSGNSDVASNWANNKIPPSAVSPCSQVLIKPQAGGQCNINTPLIIEAGATFTIVPGSIVNVSGNIIIGARLATVITNAASSVSNTSAISGGVITADTGIAITERGICFSTSPNPTIKDNIITAGTASGNFTVYLNNLVPGVTYYIKAYVKSKSITSYGNEVVFINAVLPVVATSVVSGITSSSAVSGGNVSNIGSAPVTERGVCYNTAGNPSIVDGIVLSGNGTGSYTSAITNLVEANTTYYIRAYAKNYAGTAYGNTVSFKTAPGLAMVKTDGVDLFGTTATLFGLITNTGGTTIIAKGFCYNNNGNPTLNDNFVASSGDLNEFVSSISNLEERIIYFARAFATNSFGTEYGSQVSFTPVCPYSGSMAGQYEVVTDEWQDWSPGSIVEVMDGPGPGQINLSKVWPNPSGATVINPLIANINLSDGTAFVPLVTYASYSGTVIRAQGTGINNEAGYVSSCSGTISLTIKMTTPSDANYGTYKLILKKK